MTARTLSAGRATILYDDALLKPRGRGAVRAACVRRRRRGRTRQRLDSASAAAANGCCAITGAAACRRSFIADLYLWTGLETTRALA